MDDYIKNFNMQINMKSRIKADETIDLLREGSCELLDIRFPFELEGYDIKFAKNISMNELPDRLRELDKKKIIVCMCPGVNRSVIAATYLNTKGFDAKFLIGGMIEFMHSLKPNIIKELTK